jgi:hypothetical protein
MMETKDIQRISVQKPLSNNPFGRPRRWKDAIKGDLLEIVIKYEAARNGSGLYPIAGLGVIGVETVDFATSVSRLRIIWHALQNPAFPAKVHLLSDDTLIEAKNITLKDIILLKACVQDVIALKDSYCKRRCLKGINIYFTKFFTICIYKYTIY